MGYFDGLTGCYFKTSADGGKLYFPWGFWGRGYAIASESDYLRLRRQLTAYTVVSLVVSLAPMIIWDRFDVGVAMAVICLIFYAVWSRSLRAGLRAADERMTMQESLTSQGTAFGPLILWSTVVVALVFVVGGIFLLVIDQESRMTGLLAVAFFGFCAAAAAYMLVRRGRASTIRT